MKRMLFMAIIATVLVSGCAAAEQSTDDSAGNPVTTETSPGTAESTDQDLQLEETLEKETSVESVNTETVSQSNAREKAQDYLDYSAFSREGLIKQLEFEGFSNADATYGTDAVGADWNAQAALKAQDYLDYSAFSRSGLIDQLEFEGFTSSEARFGADSVGL
jgi:hypothetical protein